MADFPTLSKKPDGESYKEETDNPSIDPEGTDGGYFITRPRYTRTPPTTFRFRFRDISLADKGILDTFWKTTVKGSSVGFNWTNPVTGTVHNVRFGKEMKKIEFERTGYGTNHRFDTGEIILTEV